jgi:hypothetical protein
MTKPDVFKTLPVSSDDNSSAALSTNRRYALKKGAAYAGLSILQMAGINSVITTAHAADDGFGVDFLYMQAEINRALVIGSLRLASNQALAESIVAETEDLTQYKAEFDPPRNASWVDSDLVTFMIGFSYHFLEGAGFLGRLYLVASCHYYIVYVKKITDSTVATRIKELYLYCLGASSEAKGAVSAVEDNFTTAAFNGVDTAAAILEIYRAFLFTDTATIGAYTRPSTFTAAESAKSINRFINMPLESINLIKQQKDIRWGRVITFMRVASGVPAFLKFKAQSIKAERLDDQRRLSTGNTRDEVVPYIYKDSEGQIVESKTQLVLRPGNLRGYTERIELNRTNSLIDSMLWGSTYSNDSLNKNGTYVRQKMEYPPNQYWDIESNRTVNDWNDSYLFEYYELEDFKSFGDFDLTRRINTNETSLTNLGKNLHRSLAATNSQPYTDYIIASMGLRLIAMLDITAIRFMLDNKTIDIGQMGSQLENLIRSHPYIKAALKTENSGILTLTISILVGSAVTQFILQVLMLHSAKSVHAELVQAGKKLTNKEEEKIVTDRLKTGLAAGSLTSTLLASGLLGAAGLAYPDSWYKAKGKIFAGYAFGAADFAAAITGIVSYTRSQKTASDQTALAGHIFRFISGTVTTVEGALRFYRSKATQKTFVETPAVYNPISSTKWSAAVSTVLYLAALILA